MDTRYMSLLVSLVALVALTGCQSKFTRDNFNLIQVGVDDHEDVRHMIGDPTTDLSDHWFYDDLDYHYSANVFFDAAGRVSGKEWMDSVTGEWEGRNPNADEPPTGEVRERHKKTRRIDD